MEHQVDVVPYVLALVRLPPQHSSRKLDGNPAGHDRGENASNWPSSAIAGQKLLGDFGNYRDHSTATLRTHTAPAYASLLLSYARAGRTEIWIASLRQLRYHPLVIKGYHGQSPQGSGCNRVR